VNAEYVRVALNDLHDYLRRNGLRWVRTEDTGDAIFVDVEVVDALVCVGQDVDRHAG
jgi:hypothetical protein